jgi:hydroxymethylpyrimidine pyrophosphatase-like HAD family hydrolase
LEAAYVRGEDQVAIASLQSHLNHATREEADRLGLTEQREEYASKGKKVGIRNVVTDGNVVRVDAQVVSFPAYSELAKPGNTPEVLNLSRVVGAAMILRTAPEQSQANGRLIIQHRAVSVQRLDAPKMTRGNASYTDIPGASVAGVIDATFDSPDRNPGAPDKIDTESIKNLVFKEAGEELGLGQEHFRRVVIAGMGEDAIKPHDEFLLLGETDLTASEVRETSRISSRNKNLGDADFEEKFVDIEATPEAVETLLTQVRCPLPPTHAAALVAAGYSMELQASGFDAAETWKQRVEDGVGENYRIIDETVAAFYAEYPEALQQIPERFWGAKAPARNPEGYDPAYAPDEQGLPSFEDEMVAKGLLPETRRIVAEAELYDVDGVLTEPLEKQPDERLIADLVEKLQQGIPIGLNTGRSTEWVNERVVTQLRDQVGDSRLLANLVLIGEKGGTWTHFDEQGNMLDGKSGTLTVPNELQGRVSAVIAEKYAHIMHIDPTKATMISIEINDGATNYEAFQTAQASLADELTQILNETGQQATYNVDVTTIATDIENPRVGKDLGAIRFMQWLKDRGIAAERFVTFGDSASDADMALELQRKGQEVSFVYVGPPGKLDGRKMPANVATYPGYNEGIIDYNRDRQLA